MPKHIDKVLRQSQYRKDPYFENQRNQFIHQIQEAESFNSIEKASQTNILSREIDTLIKASCLFSNPIFPTKSHTPRIILSDNKLVWSAQFSTFVNPTSNPIQLIDSSTQTLLSQCLDIFDPPSEFNPDNIPFYAIDPNNNKLLDVSLLTGAFQPFHLPDIKNIINNAARYNFKSEIDLKSAFLQCALHHNSTPLTAFSCSLGHFEFLRMPF